MDIPVVSGRDEDAAASRDGVVRGGWDDIRDRPVDAAECGDDDESTSCVDALQAAEDSVAPESPSG